MKNTVHTPMNEAALFLAALKGPPHMRPIWSALRVGCDVLLLGQNGLEFDPPPTGNGAIVIIEDDTEEGTSGPDGFDASSVVRLAQSVDSIAILSREPIPKIYEAAAEEAMLGYSVLIVETSPEHEYAWFVTLAEAAPDRLIILDGDGPTGRSL
ncbi:hypothetical protein MEME101129_21935 [Methylobacterium mesophilicum]|uniref:hypothetical protein n=1 Tax=Methylobacterium mesophilicum TaxID=39956 RepID=UPI003608C141